ncbi:MAG: SagB family peptide dehydrogenase [Actinomycetota bacterium]|nr:SagB family peptide dehydrogenase [Actinomycetota bacterium]
MSAGTLQERLRIRSDGSVGPGPDGRVVLREGHMQMPFGPLGPALGGAIELLGAEGASEAELVTHAIDTEGEGSVLKLQILLRRLHDSGWLDRVLIAPGQDNGGGGGGPGDALATLRPIGHTPPPRSPALDLSAPVALSRFAHLRAQDGEAIVQSPRATATLVLHEPRLAALLAGLATPRSPADLEPELAGLGLDQAGSRTLLRLLGDATLLINPGGEEAESLVQWSFADLLFHARSRVGRHLGDYGGSYRLQGSVEPLPAVRPAREPAIALPRPDPDALSGAQMPLAVALEQRRSRREHDPQAPITVAELGELLHRAARVRSVFRDESQELSSRPYPGGGALYELELYPLIHRCRDLEPGLYHYDPAGHALGLAAEPGPGPTLLLEYARRTAVIEQNPQVLLIVAARFGRAMWKYESMAYALILKDVGVLYQTICLVATGMGLAACPLGGGHADAFAAAAGLDYYAETSVGELILGRPIPAGATAA